MRALPKIIVLGMCCFGCVGKYCFLLYRIEMVTFTSGISLFAAKVLLQ